MLPNPLFFKKFIFENKLFDLGFSGPYFTWCNAQIGFAHKWTRLDRFLANINWLLSYKEYSNHHLSHTNSDYSPLFLNVRNSSKFSNNIFRFENIWLNYEGCHDSVFRAWSDDSSASPMHSFMHSISCTKHNILRWKRSGLCHIDKEISNIQGEIKRLEIVDAS